MYKKAIKESIQSCTIPKLLVQFAIAGLTEHGMFNSSIPSGIGVSNKYKFGDGWIIMCCNGIYHGKNDEPSTNWDCVECTHDNKHWYHIGCLKKAFGYGDNDIKDILSSPESVFKCPSCSS